MSHRDTPPTRNGSLPAIPPPGSRPGRRRSPPLACFMGVAAAMSLTACAGLDSGDVDDPPVHGTDQAGVEMAAYGVTEAPCGDDAHLATVVTANGAYHAFCADSRGRTSLFVMAPADAQVQDDPASALEHYLSITPRDVAVPRLLEAADALPSGRRVTSEVVAFVHPDAREPRGQLRSGLGTKSSCSSATDFVNAHCSLIDDWIEDGLDDDAFADWTSWCSSGLLAGDAQRTGSSQGVPNPHEARIRVVGCSDDVLVRRYYQNPFNATWWNAGNFTVQPGFAMSWKIFWFNATWCEGEGDLEFCTGANDMRFRVEPTPGGTYRYTGGFVTPTPVP